MSDADRSRLRERYDKLNIRGVHRLRPARRHACCGIGDEHSSRHCLGKMHGELIRRTRERTFDPQGGPPMQDQRRGISTPTDGYSADRNAGCSSTVIGTESPE